MVLAGLVVVGAGVVGAGVGAGVVVGGGCINKRKISKCSQKKGKDANPTTHEVLKFNHTYAPICTRTYK